MLLLVSVGSTLRAVGEKRANKLSFSGFVFIIIFHENKTFHFCFLKRCSTLNFVTVFTTEFASFLLLPPLGPSTMESETFSEPRPIMRKHKQTINTTLLGMERINFKLFFGKSCNEH